MFCSYCEEDKLVEIRTHPNAIYEKAPLSAVTLCYRVIKEYRKLMVKSLKNPSYLPPTPLL